MKKSNKNCSNNFPFENETKQMKYEFIQMIQSMSDEEFNDFIFLFYDFLHYTDFLDEDLVEDFYEEDELPF